MAKTETADFLKRFRVESGRGFRLKDFAPADTHGFKSKPLKGFDGVAAGNVARQFHAVASTGSLTK